MAKSITSEVIDLKGVVLSFPKVFAAERHPDFPDQPPKFSAAFLLNPNDPGHARKIKEIKAISKKIAEQMWPDKIPSSLEFCWGDGDDLDKVYAGYEGMFYLRAKNGARPHVLNRDATRLNEEDDKMYPGAVVHAKVTLWVQNNAGGKRINANLLGVQFVRDGERLGGGNPVSADDFAPVDDEDGAGPEGLFD